MDMKNISLAVCLGVVSTQAGALAASEAVPMEWKAGVARVKITPEKPMWLGGYGGREHVSEGVLQDIWAKALAIEDAAGKVGVIVTMDLCLIPMPLYRDLFGELKTRYGLERDQVILNASHTHSGPLVSRVCGYSNVPEEILKLTDEYMERLTGKVADLVGEALSKREPARIRTANGTVRFAVNRRTNREGTIRSATAINGPVDHSVPVMKVERADGSALAILFGYACHNTVLCGYLVCGDWAGYAQSEIEKAHPGATALFFQGAGGDQNPLPRRKVSLAMQYGREIAASVDQVLSDEMPVRESRLGIRFESIMLPLDGPISDERLREYVKKGGWEERSARFLMEARARGVKDVLEYPYPVACWSIGGQRLFALGGEIVAGYAVEIKRRYGADSFVMGYTDSITSYITTPDMFEAGGYEVESGNLFIGIPGRWSRDIMDMILAAVDRVAARTENH